METGIFIEEVPHKITELEIDAEGGVVAPKGESRGFICGFVSKGNAFNIVGSEGTPNVYTDRIEAAAVATFWLTVHESSEEQAENPEKSPRRPAQPKKPVKGKNTPRPGK